MAPQNLALHDDGATSVALVEVSPRVAALHGVKDVGKRKWDGVDSLG
jgi:hypothetical protein